MYINKYYNSMWLDTRHRQKISTENIIFPMSCSLDRQLYDTHLLKVTRSKSTQINQFCLQSLEQMLAWIFWPGGRSTSKSVKTIPVQYLGKHNGNKSYRRPYRKDTIQPHILFSWPGFMAHVSISKSTVQNHEILYYTVLLSFKVSMHNFMLLL